MGCLGQSIAVSINVSTMLNFPTLVMLLVFCFLPPSSSTTEALSTSTCTETREVSGFGVSKHCACAVGMDAHNITGLSSLPDHIVEVVLAKLSLVELSRIFTTCRSFYTAYRSQTARGQKSISALVENTCGPGRIACILGVIARFLEGKRVHPGFVNTRSTSYYVSADGVMYPTGSPPKVSSDLCISVVLLSPRAHPTLPNEFRVSETERPRSYFIVAVWRHRKGVKIRVVPESDADLGGVALLLSLLGMGLAQAIHDAGQHAEVSVCESADMDKFTREGLQAQIALLLPFASRRTSVGYRPDLSRGGRMEECIHIRGFGSAAPALGKTGTSGCQTDMIWPVLWEGCVRRLVRRCRSLVVLLRQKRELRRLQS
jgi:hypothetical protein